MLLLQDHTTLLRRINPITIRLYALGALFLALGMLCYLALRTQPLAIIPTWLWQAFEGLHVLPDGWPGELIGALPSLSHTAGMLLWIAASLHAWPRRMSLACATWLCIAILAEVGEPGNSVSWRDQGTFDPLDLMATFGGACIAALLIQRERILLRSKIQ